jgi:hypothetical protein
MTSTLNKLEKIINESRKYKDMLSHQRSVNKILKNFEDPNYLGLNIKRNYTVEKYLRGKLHYFSK